MIADTLQNIARYRGLHRNLDTAIDYLLAHDLRALPDGRIDIDGERVFLSVQSPAFRRHDQWELHRRYMDVQIALKDGETIAYLPAAAFEQWNDAKAANDFYSANDARPGAAFTLSPGDFVLFFPGEPHRPGLGEGQGRKAVVKVLID